MVKGTEWKKKKINSMRQNEIKLTFVVHKKIFNFPEDPWTFELLHCATTYNLPSSYSTLETFQG